MKQFKLVFILMAILFLAFPQLGFAKDTKNVGKIASVSGTVELKKSGGKKEFKAVRNMSVTQGDTISTGAKSKVVLHIDGDKEVTIAANTKVVIKQLVKSIKAEQGKTQLSLVGGKVKVKINKKLQGDSKFQVQTPNAIMGVMGTEFDVAYGEGQTTVGVNEGVVRVTPTSAPDGTPGEQEYDVHPQQVTQVNGDGSTPPRPMTDADRAFFDSDSDLSQEPTDNEQNPSSAQSIQYGPPGNVDDDDAPSGGGSDNNNGGTGPTIPGDSGNTPAPGDTTSPGDTTDPSDTPPAGTTTDTGTVTPPLSQYDEGFNTGAAAKKAQLLDELNAEGFMIGEEQARNNSMEASEQYAQGNNDGYSTPPDPMPDFTSFYEAGHSDGYPTGYNEGYLAAAGTAPPAVTLTEYEQGYQAGFDSIELREFETTTEAVAQYEQGVNDATTLWATLSNDAAYELGFERGQAEYLEALQQEQYNQGYSEGYEQGYNTGYAEGLANTP